MRQIETIGLLLCTDRPPVMTTREHCYHGLPVDQAHKWPDPQIDLVPFPRENKVVWKFGSDAMILRPAKYNVQRCALSGKTHISCHYLPTKYNMASGNRGFLSS